MGHGGRTRPTRRRLVDSGSPITAVHVAEPEVDDSIASEVPTSNSSAAGSRTVPPATVRVGLPFLWSEVGKPAELCSGPSSSPSLAATASVHSATVRSALPFLWADRSCQSPNSATLCELYLNGECPHGISGKMNGICNGLHPKRCNKYMKWVKRHDKGCKGTSCDKAHPVICDRSHDLKCFVQNCPFKLHTQKCVRIEQHQQQLRGPNINSMRHVGH